MKKSNKRNTIKSTVKGKELKWWKIATLVFITLIIILLVRLSRPPSPEEVRIQFEDLSDSDIFAYEVLDGKPYMLFSSYKESTQIHFDKLIHDLKYSLVNLGPKMVWSGAWYSMPKANGPGSVGYGYCTGVIGLLPPECKSTDVFGQINDKNIRYLELFYDGQWNRFSVNHPGFVIRLPNYNSELEKARFLSEDGKIIFELQPLKAS